jgi:hypothetical protein
MVKLAFLVASCLLNNMMLIIVLCVTLQARAGGTRRGESHTNSIVKSESKKYMEAFNKCDGSYIFEAKIVSVSRTLQDLTFEMVALPW